MKKALKVIFSAVGIAVVLWLAVFSVDYARTMSLKEPIFAVPPSVTADDGGSGVFRGLGYTVGVEKHIDAEYGVKIVSVEMRMFGKIVAAAIE